jgi:hypothetical protein
MGSWKPVVTISRKRGQGGTRCIKYLTPIFIAGKGENGDSQEKPRGIKGDNFPIYAKCAAKR